MQFGDSYYETFIYFQKGRLMVMCIPVATSTQLKDFHKTWYKRPDIGDYLTFEISNSLLSVTTTKRSYEVLKWKQH
jgi:hypothetical protein